MTPNERNGVVENPLLMSKVKIEWLEMVGNNRGNTINKVSRVPFLMHNTVNYEQQQKTTN